MWRKSLATLVVASLLLAGCGSYDEIPGKHETPMESIENDEKNLNHSRAEGTWNSSDFQDATGSNQFMLPVDE